MIEKWNVIKINKSIIIIKRNDLSSTEDVHLKFYSQNFDLLHFSCFAISEAMT